MDKKRKLRKISLTLYLVWFLNLFFCQNSIATPWWESITYVKLTLENQPNIGGIAILKLTVVAPKNLEKAKISCFLPEGLDFINDRNYQVIRTQTLTTRELGYEVTFYSGPMQKGEKKEFIFKVHIPDGRKYLITVVGGDDYYGSLEIDLGDPEPPEWEPKNISDTHKEYVNDKKYILSGIKQVKDDEVTELKVPEDALPPLRTELKVRTKDKPNFDYHREFVLNPQPRKDVIIPVRYLIYTEEESPQVKATLIIPQGLEFMGEEIYKISSLKDGRKEILLYSGSMRFKQCKVFYFKAKALSWQEELPLETISQFTTLNGKTLIKEDRLIIDLRRKF